MKVLKFLKKYGALIGIFLAGLFLAFFMNSSWDDWKEKRATKKKIKEVNDEIDKVEDTIENVESDKEETLEDIADKEKEIEDLKDKLGDVDNNDTDIDEATDFLKDFADRNKDK